MPHLTLQYTANIGALDVGAALHAVNRAALASGLFDDADIKSRAFALESYRVGVATEPSAFVYLLVAMSARGQETERRLADSLADALDETLAGICCVETQICVEIVHVDTRTYVKRTAGAFKSGPK